MLNVFILSMIVGGFNYIFFKSIYYCYLFIYFWFWQFQSSIKRHAAVCHGNDLTTKTERRQNTCDVHPVSFTGEHLELLH